MIRQPFFSNSWCTLYSSCWIHVDCVWLRWIFESTCKLKPSKLCRFFGYCFCLGRRFQQILVQCHFPLMYCMKIWLFPVVFFWLVYLYFFDPKILQDLPKTQNIRISRYRREYPSSFCTHFVTVSVDLEPKHVQLLQRWCFREILHWKIGKHKFQGKFFNQQPLMFFYINIAAEEPVKVGSEYWISCDLWSNLPGGWHQITEQFSAQCPQISQTKVLPKSTAPIRVCICVYFRMTSTSSQKLDS